MDDLISRQAEEQCEMTLTLNNPLTEEQWDAITDVDFEHTNEVVFHTKHGKEVKFVKASAQQERKKGHYIGEADGYADGELVYDIWSCSECGCYFEDWDEEPTYNFCPNCGADMRGED